MPELTPTAERRVSAIVPARNEEANIAKAVRSLAEQPEIVEIIVVNDQSTDGTAQALADLAPSVPLLRVLEAGALPEGWVGKSHAVWLGAQQAVGEWLLLTDADAVHLPGSTGRALTDAAAAGASMISYSPHQEIHTWWEYALIPFMFCRLSQLYPYAAVSDPDSPAAAVNGIYILIRKDAYFAIGGHEAVRQVVGLEDVVLAMRAKAAGVRLHFAIDDGRIANVRMYTRFAAMWEGWTKNLYPLVTVAGQSVTKELLAVIPWIPLLCLLLSPIHLAFGALGILLLAGRHGSYAAMLRRNRLPLRSILYYGPGVALYCAALLVSEWRYLHGKVSWKGREYPGHSPSSQTR